MLRKRSDLLRRRPSPSWLILPVMDDNTLTQEPATFRAGDSISWTRSLADYPPADGWVLKYAFRGPSKKDFSATPLGVLHLVALDSQASSIPAGEYHVQGYVEKGGARFTVFADRITVLPDLVNAADDYDPRSFAERTLEAVEAVLSGTATRSQKKQKFDDTELEYFTLAELLSARTRLRREVRREKELADRAAGRPSRRIIRTISRGY